MPHTEYLIRHRSTPKTGDIRYILKHGLKQSGDCFSVYVTVPQAGKKPGFFVTNISKKSVRNSVDRNRYKRWIRAACHANRGISSGLNLLVMPRQGMAKLGSYAEIEAALVPQMRQAAAKLPPK